MGEFHMVWDLVLSISTKLLLISMMLGFGLTMTMKDVSGPLKRYRFMIIALVLNILLIPLIGFGLAVLFGITGALAVGFVLIVMAPGAAFAPKLTQIAKSNVYLSIALMFLLALVGIISIPITLILMVPGSVNVNPIPIAMNLIVFQLLPLFIGIILFTYWAKGATKLAPIFGILTNILMIVVIGLTLILYWPALVGVVGSYLIMASLIVIGLSILLGYFFGVFSGEGRDPRVVLTFGSTQRNAGAAMMIALASFALFPEVLVAVTVYALLQTIFVVLVAFLFKKQKGPAEEVPSEE